MKKLITVSVLMLVFFVSASVHHASATRKIIFGDGCDYTYDYNKGYYVNTSGSGCPADPHDHCSINRPTGSGLLVEQDFDAPNLTCSSGNLSLPRCAGNTQVERPTYSTSSMMQGRRCGLSDSGVTSSTGRFRVSSRKNERRMKLSKVFCSF